MTPHRLLVWIAITLALLHAACSSTEGTGGELPAPGQPFGAACQRTEDCASRLCIRRDENGGICTRTCDVSFPCPTSPNWGCVQPEDFSTLVCACVPDSTKEVCGDGVDNDCNGLSDDCLSCNGKSVPADDPAHCGSCDNVCAPGQLCSLGECKCPADTPFECSGKCTSFDSDAQNCGACGKACGAGQACKNGACSCADSSKPDICPDVGCLNLDSDSSNCGSCGKVCPAGLGCVNGTCACPDSTKPDYCAEKGCLNLKTDTANCGSCGKACASGAWCNASECVCPGAKLDICSNTCVDLWSDELNCGTCGNACATVQSCQSGVCKCPLYGTSLCKTECVNLNTDAFNCGTCGAACKSFEVCSLGKCICSPYYPDVCSGTCVDLKTNSANCGSCGNVCPTGQSCTNGVCLCTGYGLTACGANCVDIKADANNCGSCGNVCPMGQSCVSGACKCPTNQTWCTQSSTCESLSTDPKNCGTCGKTCNSGEICSVGACMCPTAGQKWCTSTGQCTDTYSSNAHCGICDKQCPTATHCSYGSCVCDQTGATLCGTECAVLTSDAKHCGSCTNSCAANMVCTSSKCGCPTPVIGTAVRLTTTAMKTRDPHAAWSGTYVGVAYLEDDGGGNEVYFALLNPDGTRAKSPDLKLTNLTGSSHTVTGPPDIIWNGSEFALVWLQWTFTKEIMFQRIDGDGTLKGAAVSVTAKTTGSALPMQYPPRIVWSSSYGGHALASAGYSGGYLSVGFQRIGTDASVVEAVNSFTASANGAVAMAVAPSGEWAMGYLASNSAYLAFFNPDGSKTKPVETLGTTYTFQYRALDLLHDGTTWLTAWSGYPSYSYGITVNRGAAVNSPSSAIPLTKPDAELALERAGSALEITYLVNNVIKLRRFQIPSTTSSTLTSIAPEVSVLSTPNAVDLDTERTGANSMLVLWSDNRWGSEELYAAPVDLVSCP